MKIMIAMLDPDGLPRAWAAGFNYGIVLHEAERQLDLYRAEKRAVGDPLADAKFTSKLMEVDQ